MWTELPIAPLLVLLTLCIAGYWFVVRMRDFSKNDRKTPADHKKKFEEIFNSEMDKLAKEKAGN